MKKSSLIPLLAIIFLSACNSIPRIDSKKIDYKSAGKLPPLEVPPDLTTPGVDNRYAVPEIGGISPSAPSPAKTQVSVPESTLPTTIANNNNVEKFRIERSGSQRWLVINASATDLWPVVKQFWIENGFILKTESQATGIMETDWAENRAKIPQGIIRSTIGKVFDGAFSTPERDKFRTRLEPVGNGKTTEIYISHRGVEEIYTSEGKDRTVWQPKPSQPELEAEMLQRLMVKLGAEQSKAQQLIATNPGAPRAALDNASNGTQLKLTDSYERAWRRVGLALDRVNFTVEDRDRSKGIYFVRYVDPEKDAQKEQGLFSKLKFWESKPSVDSSAQYQVWVKTEGEGTRLSVHNSKSEADNSKTAKRIAELLLEQLK